MGDIVDQATSKLFDLGIAGVVVVTVLALLWFVVRFNRQLQQERLNDVKAELERERHERELERERLRGLWNPGKPPPKPPDEPPTKEP